MTFPIPEALLASHMAALGKTRSGKTSTTKLVVEHVAADGYRVCVLDTIKSDWWGVISSASGKKPGLPFTILGGSRGHVPLHSGAGKAIGELVAKGSIPLSVLDMADFEPGGLQRFFADFAQALWKNIRGVLYLVIEEAHEVAPKEVAGFGGESMAIHWAKKLATGGGSKGIRLIVATQRTQALHNAVLGSCETVFAHRLTAPADQKPVLDWLKANVGDKEKQAEIAASMASLQTGTAWVCSGEARYTEKISFPKFETFDNSKTPEKDAAEIAITSAPVDQAALRSIIGEAVQDAEANDPKTLKAEIARLQAALSTNATTNPVEKVDISEQLNVAQAYGFERGRDAGIKIGLSQAAGDIDAVLKRIRDAAYSDDQSSMSGQFADLRNPSSPGQRPAAGPASPLSRARFSNPERAAVPQRRAPAAQASGSAAGNLSNPQLHLLRALAWWFEMGHAKPSRAQLAAIAKWKVGGSNLRGRLAELSAGGLISYPDSKSVALTEAGIQAAPEPDIGETLMSSIRSMLTNPQRMVFDAMKPGVVHSRQTIAERLNWEPGGSNMRGRLAELSALELIDYPSKGEVALQDWVR